MRTGSKFCMYCGQAISEDAKFCPLCGKSQKINHETEKQVSAAVQEKAETMTYTIKNTLADVSQRVQEADLADKAKSAAHIRRGNGRFLRPSDAARLVCVRRTQASRTSAPMPRRKTARHRPFPLRQQPARFWSSFRG